MHRPFESSRHLDEQAMIRRLKREGAAARSEFSEPLCRRILQAVDEAQQARGAANPGRIVALPARDLARGGNPLRRSQLPIAVTAAAALLAGLGYWAWTVSELPQPAAVRSSQTAPATSYNPSFANTAAQTDEPATSLFSATTVAVESWAALKENADPLAELNHDAKLAGQMVMAAIPLADQAGDY